MRVLLLAVCSECCVFKRHVVCPVKVFCVFVCKYPGGIGLCSSVPRRHVVYFVCGCVLTAYCVFVCHLTAYGSMAFLHQVYPIGIPIGFGVLLWRKRHLIDPAKNVHPTDASSLSEGQPGPPSDSDPRLVDRRIAQTAFLWRVSCSKGNQGKNLRWLGCTSQTDASRSTVHRRSIVAPNQPLRHVVRYMLVQAEPGRRCPKSCR